jgi:hypothetical protein
MDRVLFRAKNNRTYCLKLLRQNGTKTSTGKLDMGEWLK